MDDNLLKRAASGTTAATGNSSINHTDDKNNNIRDNFQLKDVKKGNMFN